MKLSARNQLAGTFAAAAKGRFKGGVLFAPHRRGLSPIAPQD